MLIVLIGAATGLWGLNRITEETDPILSVQIPTVRVIEETLSAMMSAQLSAERALDLENVDQLTDFNSQNARFANARDRIETLLAALTWGSESDAFMRSGSGLYARAWEGFGYRHELILPPPDKTTAQRAGATSIYFQGF